MKNGNYSEVLRIRLSKEDINNLEEVADFNGLTVSSLVRSILRSYFIQIEQTEGEQNEYE